MGKDLILTLLLTELKPMTKENMKDYFEAIKSLSSLLLMNFLEILDFYEIRISVVRYSICQMK